MKQLKDEALALEDEKKYDEADAKYEKLFKMQQEYLGQGHPDTMETQVSMMRVIDNRIDSGEGVSTAEEIDRTAFDLNDQGRHAESYLVQEQVFERRKKELGEDHPKTLILMLGMAGLLGKQGKNEESLAMLKKLLDKQSRVLG